MKTHIVTLLCLVATLCGCSSGRATSSAENEDVSESAVEIAFDADSAYSYVKRQVDFGPRVSNTSSHRDCGDWLESELRRHGAEVTVQNVDLQSFDGVTLHSRNILGQFNKSLKDRILLVAHWDTRPWADQDPDESKQKEPVPGANDGASGVGVLLELARHIGKEIPDKGIDVLFVDAEDRGSEGDDDTWALGAKAFVANPPVGSYRPSKVVLLDMVGGEGARFYREQFSDYYSSPLVDELWRVASDSGYSSRFVNSPGGAITDDHLEFVKAGIPAIDIIEFNSSSGFPAVWHTTSDDMEHISAETLKAVGQTVLNWLTK